MKVRATNSKAKTKVITLFVSWRLIHSAFVPPSLGQTITLPFYKEVLDSLMRRIHRVMAEMYKSGGMVPSKCQCSSTLIIDCLTISQSPFSPDLAPTDFFLVPKLKMALRVQCFGNLETIQKNVTDVLNNFNGGYACFSIVCE